MPRSADAVRRSRSPARRYTDEEKRKALTVAATIGKEAAAQELGVSRASLHAWQKEFPKHWSDQVAGRADAYRKQFAASLEDLAERYAGAEDLAITEAIRKLESGELDAKELAALIKSMGSSRGVASHSASRARGEPDSTTRVTVDFPQLEAAMHRALEAGVVDGTAEDLDAPQ